MSESLYRRLAQMLSGAATPPRGGQIPWQMPYGTSDQQPRFDIAAGAFAPPRAPSGWMGENAINQSPPVPNPPLAQPPPAVARSDFGSAMPGGVNSGPAIVNMAPQFDPASPYMGGNLPAMTLGQQAAPAGRNELERDYYRQLAANPNGFDKGWLARLLG